MRLKLKTAILRSGKTQRAISLKLGIPETRFSALVRGHVEPDKRERRALASFFREDPEALLDQEVAPPASLSDVATRQVAKRAYKRTADGWATGGGRTS